MNKWIVGFLAIGALWGCRDEFNIPEYEDNTDGDGPTIEIVTPAENSEYYNTTTVPIDIIFRDNFFLSEVTVEIAKQDSLDRDYIVTEKTNDSLYRFTGTYTLPFADTTTYEVFLTARDSVGYETLESYLFKASQ